MLKLLWLAIAGLLLPLTKLGTAGFDSPCVTDDFMVDREQPELQERESLVIKYMLDTDISIYTMKRKPLEVRKMFNIHTGEICISTVTLGELIFGAEKTENSRANLESIEGFAGRLEVLNYDEAAAHQFGQLRQELKGQNIGSYDFMIAAHARSLGLILVTSNTKEFEHVDGLRIENWINETD